MRRFTLACCTILITIAAGCTVTGLSEVKIPADPTDEAGKPKRGLRAFRNDEELRDYLARIRKARNERTKDSASNTAAASPSLSESKGVATSAADSESVTNVQHAGVDEGGIVKVHGDHLVILRRGRLFSVKIGGNMLRPVSAIDAFGPDINPSGTWYDEMLISGDRVVVVGYSYQRGGTEIGLFRIGRDGGLSYDSTYHLRSNDYYSSRNYSSRLIGQKLIFYTPSYLSIDDRGTTGSFPAVRRWRTGATAADFRVTAPATRVYRGVIDDASMAYPALHSVTVCDLARPEMQCESTSLIGPPGNVFYVSPSSVYVWTTNWQRGNNRSIVYRMPLDGSTPTALGALGSPTDQFSFYESDDGHLNVLLRSNSRGNWMWGAESADGRVALFRVPTSEFSDGSKSAVEENYTVLPKPAGYALQNRFVGDFVLYGTGSGWRRPAPDTRSSLFAANWKSGAVSEIELPHGVDRIEALGSDAVAVGTDGKDLYFSGIRLGSDPRLAGRYVYEGGTQGETRSHGFFYKPDGRQSGILGLPVRGSGQPGYRHLVEGSASVLFIRNDSMNFREIGELTARSLRSVNDGCKASCVDWYGNARPLFLKGRVFALMGYELVEGNLQNGSISETRRVDFSSRTGRSMTDD
jgi:hypothetical protein